MRLSCPEQMLGDRPLAEKARLIAEAGFDGIDLRHATAVAAAQDGEIARLGLPVAAIYSQVRDPSPLDPVAARRAEAVATVIARARLAAAVGAGKLILVPIFGDARIAFSGQGARITEVERAMLLVALNEIAAEIADLPIAVVLEPLNAAETHFLTDPAEAAAICDEIDSPRVATMVDTYHCHREGHDIPAKVDATGRHLALVHLSDSDRGLPGEGVVDFAAALRALDEAGYDGWAGFECRRIETDADIAALGASVAHVRSLVGQGALAAR